MKDQTVIICTKEIEGVEITISLALPSDAVRHNAEHLIHGFSTSQFGDFVGRVASLTSQLLESAEMSILESLATVARTHTDSD